MRKRKKTSHQSDQLIRLHAREFQTQLDELADTVAYKVQRELPKRGLLKPAFIVHDIYMLLRQTHQCYRLFMYMSSTERRVEDPNWRIAYNIAILPTIRNMIDCLYNVTALLENPGPRGYQFRESGYKLALKALDDDERRYRGHARWDNYVDGTRKRIRSSMASDRITIAEVEAAKIWPTLSGYLRLSKNNPDTPNKQFLRLLTYGFWQEYSGIAHATFQGLLATAAFYVPKDWPMELHPGLDSAGERVIFSSVSRAAAILLSLLTELQCRFRFDGANINRRLHAVWRSLRKVPEIKELYDRRYRALMKSAAVNDV
jgi:hypothetical protein